MLLANEFTSRTARISEIGFDGWVRNHMPLHVCGVAVGLVLVTISITTACVAFWGPSDIPILARLSSVHSAGAHRQDWLAHRFPAGDRHIPAKPSGYRYGRS